MKVRTILISLFFLFIAFELINGSNLSKKNLLIKKSEKNIIKEKRKLKLDPQLQAIIDVIGENNAKLYCKETSKPSGAFTAILMVYMVLIIAGAILVLVLLREDLSK